MPNKKRSANDMTLGSREPPSKLHAAEQPRTESNEPSKRLKSVVAGFGIDEMDRGVYGTARPPTAPRHHERSGQARSQHALPPAIDRWVPPQASVGGRLGEQSELRARDVPIRDLVQTDHGDELKQEQTMTADLRAEVATKNEELTAKNKALLEKDEKFKAKQRQLGTLMATKESEVNQKLKALAQVRELDREVKKNQNIAKVATSFVSSSARGEWKKSGELMEDLVAAVEDQERMQPQASSNAIDLTGEEDHGPYRVSLESSITNRFRRDD